jgi:hypothetical protein
MGNELQTKVSALIFQVPPGVADICGREYCGSAIFHSASVGVDYRGYCEVRSLLVGRLLALLRTRGSGEEVGYLCQGMTNLHSAQNSPPQIMAQPLLLHAPKCYACTETHPKSNKTLLIGLA